MPTLNLTFPVRRFHNPEVKLRRYKVVTWAVTKCANTFFKLNLPTV